MSPRAAWRLESLGYSEVYDYVAGKADWLAAGLPFEGTAAAISRIGEAARKDVPTCGLREHVRDGRVRAEAAGYDTCMVVNEQRVVLGRLYKAQLEGDPDASVEEVMKSGPSTYRPNMKVSELLSVMRQHNLKTAPVTTSDGKLVGMVVREDAERLTGSLSQ